MYKKNCISFQKEKQLLEEATWNWNCRKLLIVLVVSSGLQTICFSVCFRQREMTAAVRRITAPSFLSAFLFILTQSADKRLGRSHWCWGNHSSHKTEELRGILVWLQYLPSLQSPKPINNNPLITVLTFSLATDEPAPAVSCIIRKMLKEPKHNIYRSLEESPKFTFSNEFKWHISPRLSTPNCFLIGFLITYFVCFTPPPERWNLIWLASFLLHQTERGVFKCPWGVLNHQTRTETTSDIKLAFRQAFIY